MLLFQKGHIKKEYISFLSVVFAIAIYVFLTKVTGIGCPILFISGIPCLGCGMTRACWSLLQGDIITALTFHPLVFLLPVIFILLYREIIGISKKADWIAWIIIIILFVMVYLIRLLSSDEVLQIKIYE